MFDRNCLEGLSISPEPLLPQRCGLVSLWVVSVFVYMWVFTE